MCTVIVKCKTLKDFLSIGNRVMKVYDMIEKEDLGKKDLRANKFLVQSLQSVNLF